jgi:hypothetical protein
VTDKAVGDYTLGQLSHVLGTTSASVVARAAANNTPRHGRLERTSSSVLTFAPFNGNQIKINGVSYQIPNAGVTLAFGALSTTTLYYIYAYISGSTLTLEASTTTHATSTTSGNEGVEIKSGDDTRTLVGLSYTIASTFVDFTTLSWFNKRQKTASLSLGNLSTASATFVALGSLQSAVNWANDIVDIQIAAQISTTGTNGAIEIGIDGTTAVGLVVQYSYSTLFVATVVPGKVAPSEALHTYGVVAAAVAGGGTASFNNCFISVTVWG